MGESLISAAIEPSLEDQPASLMPCELSLNYTDEILKLFAHFLNVVVVNMVLMLFER